jgi:hypothetical protein
MKFYAEMYEGELRLTTDFIPGKPFPEISIRLKREIAHFRHFFPCMTDIFV